MEILSIVHLELLLHDRVTLSITVETAVLTGSPCQYCINKHCWQGHPVNNGHLCIIDRVTLSTVHQNMLLTRVITTNQELRNVINQSLSYICFTLSAVYMRCLIDSGQILFSFPVLISLNEVPPCFYGFFYLPPLFFKKDNLLFIFLVFILFAELFRHQFSSESLHILVACFLSLTSKLKSVSGVSHATDQSIKFKGWYGLRSGCRGKKHDISQAGFKITPPSLYALPLYLSVPEQNTITRGGS